MTWRRPVLAAACCATALGCAEATPLATTPQRHLLATTAPPPATLFQPILWCNGTGVVLPGNPANPDSQNVAFSIVAGSGTLPAGLQTPATVPGPKLGAVYMFNGNTSNPNGTTSMYGYVSTAVIVPNAVGGGGKATLTGTNTEGFPFTIVATDSNLEDTGDILDVDAPGLFKGKATLTNGDLRIVHALPRGQGNAGQPGIVFDKAIGLFISQADADEEHPGPQQIFTEWSNDIIAPPPQLPAPDADPADTTNQDEVDYVRGVPNPPKL